MALGRAPSWGSRGDPAWLPKNGGEAWRRLFEGEDMAGAFLRDRGTELPWRVAAEAVSLLASVLGEYRVQLRIAEDEAARCNQSSSHLLAGLDAAGRGAEPPQRSHPGGPWRVRAMAATWTDLESCEEADDHETSAAAAMSARIPGGPSGPDGLWRHLILLRVDSVPVPVELSVHEGQAGADASVAVARATDDEAWHWAEPVAVGPRPTLQDVAGSSR